MPKRSAHRITKRFVDAARARDRDEVFFDRDLPGFGVRVRPSGTATYLVQFRDAEGRSRRMSLGRHGPLTCEQARLRALATLGRVAHGENPADERQTARKAATVAELGEHYFAEAEAGRVRGKRGLPKKASTLRIDRYRWRDYVFPLIGRRAARELTRKDIVEFLGAAEDRAKDVGRTGAGERRLKGMLGGVLSWAAERGVIETNPCWGIKTRPDSRRRIALDDAQYRTLGAALACAEEAGEAWQAFEAMRLVALTGCRRGEIVCLRWREVDLEGQALRLADSKTGASVRPLGQAARDVLRRISNLSARGEFVFPAVRGANGAYSGLPRAWRRIVGKKVVTQSGEALTLHGLRHAFAGVAAGALKYSEPTIAALIGHAGTSVTSRYIHHLDAALVSAADAVSGRIAKLLREGAELAAFQARGTRTNATWVVADFHPEPDVSVETLITSDTLTKVLPPDVQATLARSLSGALRQMRAGLPVQRRRGTKPQAWGLDVVARACEDAFIQAGLERLVTIRRDGLKDAPIHQFLDRLLKAAKMNPNRKSLTHNAQRGRSIVRRSAGR